MKPERPEGGGEALLLRQAVVLLDGTATPTLASAIGSDVPARGPVGSMADAVADAAALAVPGGVVLLSPGCASFGLFVDEFDRGDRFRAAVGGLARSLEQRDAAVTPP